MTQPGHRRRVLVGFAALAVLAGPVRGATASWIEYPLHFQQFAAAALTGSLAGAVLLTLGLMRGEAMLGRRQWLGLGMLLVPQWLGTPLSVPLIRTIPWLHETPWGVPFLLALAAPLWLGLLAALEWVTIDVPRAVVGAGIAGIGAALLLVPVYAYRVTPSMAPVLAAHVALGILAVFSWAFAASRLVGVGKLVVAGTFLLLSATGQAAFSLLLERPHWQAVEWHDVWAPLLVAAAVLGSFWWLWFWLLEHMPLGAFCMNALAAWTAALLPGFAMFGFLSLRGDAALAIALGAVVVALHARPADEQPLALGLGD